MIKLYKLSGNKTKYILYPVIGDEINEWLDSIWQELSYICVIGDEISDKFDLMQKKLLISLIPDMIK